MKRFSLREFSLLCAPIVLVGLGLLGPRLWGHRGNNTPKIKLTLNEDKAYSTSPNWVGFGWKAEATGGPENYYQFGFDEHIVAVGPSGEQVIYPNASATGGLSWSVSTNTMTMGNAQSQFGHFLQAPDDVLPLGTTRLEWRGIVVAVPRQGGNLYSPTSQSTLQAWAQLTGANLVKKTIKLPLSGHQLEPIKKCALEQVNPYNASHGADTCITVQLKDIRRKYYRRIVAFDGKTQRVLPIDGPNNAYFVGEQEGGWDNNSTSNLLLKLRDLPDSWGTLTYLLDVVYDPTSGAGTGEETCDAATIKKLTDEGWLHYSRRLPLRIKGQKISAPNFPKTPNVQLLDIKDRLSTTDWLVDVRLRYTGKLAHPEIDSPNGPELTSSKGRYLGGNGDSYGVAPSKTPGEWIAHIKIPRTNIKGLAKGESITMKLEIADSEAAPLVIRQQFQLPTNATTATP